MCYSVHGPKTWPSQKVSWGSFRETFQKRIYEQAPGWTVFPMSGHGQPRPRWTSNDSQKIATTNPSLWGCIISIQNWYCRTGHFIMLFKCHRTHPALKFGSKQLEWNDNEGRLFSGMSYITGVTYFGVTASRTQLSKNTIAAATPSRRVG